MERRVAYRLTGIVILILGILFLLRDMGLNLIGDTSGWTIFIVLVGAGVLASGDNLLGKALGTKTAKK
ncbi:hypothetical protein HYS31_01435 [Candidatus Woesearchaeota archaeon]|nr:hypothetical protein [Candidatus Woesearchaeota archaeon]